MKLPKHQKEYWKEHIVNLLDALNEIDWNSQSTRKSTGKNKSSTDVTQNNDNKLNGAPQTPEIEIKIIILTIKFRLLMLPKHKKMKTSTFILNFYFLDWFYFYQ